MNQNTFQVQSQVINAKDHYFLTEIQTSKYNSKSPFLSLASGILLIKNKK